MKIIDGIARRCRVDLYSPAEKAIADAMNEVEEAGAHILLTEAINLLSQAKDKVADFVELDKKMTEIEQRTTIAEYCGWKWYRLPKTHSDGERFYRCLFLPSIIEDDGKLPEEYSVADMSEKVCNLIFIEKEGMVPDYLNNLNAIHEAWRTLVKKDLLIKFNNHLRFIVRREGYEDATIELLDALVIGANASQRAESFLRTIDKWKE